MKHIWGGGEKILPNVSLIEETNNVEYNPYIPPPRNDIIIYTASAKLYEVTSIHASGLHTNAFNTTIKSHTFENGVGTIEFDDNVTSIGEYAFTGCSNLTSITIPNSVTSIGESAFSRCSSLTTVTIGNGVTIIGNSAFHGCSSLTSITIPNSVTSIGEYAFYYCQSLTSIAIPDSVTSIGKYAFERCSNSTSVTIPNSVTSISSNAFSGCSNLVMIDVESGNTTYDSRDNCNAIVETATNTLITGCQNTTIPNSVTIIGNSAFHSCSSLTSITIPNSVTSIDNGAFYKCTNLASVTVESTTPPSLGSYAFDNNASGRKIYVPSASVNTYKTATNWKSYANYIEAIPTA